MRILNENKEILKTKLKEQGFKENKEKYTLNKNLINTFNIQITYENEILSSKLIDTDTEEEYLLVDVEAPIGEYSAEIKIKYEEYLEKLLKEITIPSIFKYKQTRKVMKYVSEKYKVNLEFLWEKFPNNAIYRCKDNNKWFAILVKVDESKLGLQGEGNIEALIIKHPAEEIPKIINGKTILKGYHMNKKYWITIPLDERISDGEVFKFIDESFKLVC